jgi:DNA invertase Pin-like site-specific DNA recombinase
MVRRYLTYESLAEVGAAFGVSTTVVSSELEKRGIPRRKGRLGLFDRRPEARRKLVEAGKAGASLSLLASVFECSSDAIKRVFKQEKIEINGNPKQYRFVDRKGRLFWLRSTWEMMTASWLDQEGRDWDFEKESFEVGPKRRYTPDFWIYSEDGSIDLIIDVKGWLYPGSEERICLFTKAYPEVPFELWDQNSLREKGILDQKIPFIPTVVRHGPCLRSSVTPEEIRRILDLHARGLSNKEVATALNRSETCVANHIQKMGASRPRGVTKRARSAGQQLRDTACKLYQSGRSYKTTAALTGLSVDIIRGEVLRRGKRHPRSNWSAEEDTQIRNHYDGTSNSLERCQHLLPHRTLSAMIVRASVLKLGNRKEAGKRKRAVSPDQAHTAIERHDTGETWRAIAASMGVSRQALRLAVKDATNNA